MISMPSFRCSFLIQNQALLPHGMPWIACSRLGKWAGSFDGAWPMQAVEKCGKHGAATIESIFKHSPEEACASITCATCYPKEAAKFSLDKIDA